MRTPASMPMMRIAYSRTLPPGPQMVPRPYSGGGLAVSVPTPACSIRDGPDLLRAHRGQMRTHCTSTCTPSGLGNMRLTALPIPIRWLSEP